MGLCGVCVGGCGAVSCSGMWCVSGNYLAHCTSGGLWVIGLVRCYGDGLEVACEVLW